MISETRGKVESRLKLELKCTNKNKMNVGIHLMSRICFYGAYFLIKAALLHNENIMQLPGDYTGCKN